MGSLDLFSSRRFEPGRSLGDGFLVPALQGACSYKRIAGYFCSSIIDIAGPELEGIVRKSGCVKVVCNARLDFVEGETGAIAKAALDEFLWLEWGQFKRERVREIDRERFRRLHELMKDGLMEVRVLHDGALGLLHGKAGLVSREEDGSVSTKAFLGSANESLGGWRRNYELLAASSDPDMVRFVQEEFDALWAMASDLPKRIVDDFGRLANRVEIDVEAWRENPDPGHALTDSMASEITPMDYQKWFIDLAFRDHRRFPWGARYVLADPVGLGKTIQMGLALKLMALWSKTPTPLLVIAPKTLVEQWQEELVKMGVPSARWDSRDRKWICEDGTFSDRSKEARIPNCPRRIGIVSAGLISNRRGRKGAGGNQFEEWLLSRSYECVVVDEAHRARRHVVAGAPFAKGRIGEQRNLIRFLRKISEKTRSMILGTATPIQIHPIEMWDLLDVLSQGNDAVLGTHELSRWSSDPEDALRFISAGEGAENIHDDRTRWEWISDPLPFPRIKSDGQTAAPDVQFEHIRNVLGLRDGRRQAAPADCVGRRWDSLGQIDREAVVPLVREIWGSPGREGLRAKSILRHTPFVRRVIRRSRKQLEEIGVLREIHVQIHGDAQPLLSPAYLIDAFEKAKEFCETLKDMPRGFIQTLLLRRLGSSKVSGLKTAKGLLDNWTSVEEWAEEDDFDDEEDGGEETVVRERQDRKKTKVGKGERLLTHGQRDLLEEFVGLVESSGPSDPKLEKLSELLTSGDRDWIRGSDNPWLADGVIVFSQYFDTAESFARRISERLPDELIAIYAGSGRSRLLRASDGTDVEADRETIKRRARDGELRLIFGTDAASEGLNLQMFGALVNLDLPWNPTRLEQRKGRIQRPGQKLSTVRVFNMRYGGSVEDEVHRKLSERLEQICEHLGQVPDCLESAWISAAQGKMDEAEKLIDGLARTNPMTDLYDSEIVEEAKSLQWDECGKVLCDRQASMLLRMSWNL